MFRTRSFPATYSSISISHADSEICIQMNRMGIFERYGVKVLGTSIKTLETSEDRDLLYVRLHWHDHIRSGKGDTFAGAIADRRITARKL